MGVPPSDVAAFTDQIRGNHVFSLFCVFSLGLDVVHNHTKLHLILKGLEVLQSVSEDVKRKLSARLSATIGQVIAALHTSLL